jgi:acetyl-CoA carboxylase biotin carboxyl carrier protein
VASDVREDKGREEKREEKKGLVITSPFVGTFYRSPAPDQPAYVEVGASVKKGQTLCIIEAMKLMNEIEADVTGKVTEVLAQNGQPVEFGQPLFRIEP